MVKYSEEFKLKIVSEYIDGQLGYKLLASKYGIKSREQIRNWVNVYEKYGIEGLFRKRTNEIYTVQFKLDVLSFMLKTGASRSETALHFDLTNPPIISSWKKKFLEGGEEALDQPKGRPAMFR